jgi:phospholipid transport system substrate-binding protein
MKNGRTLGQSGRFTQLEPVIRRTFDIPSMARLAVGSSWGTLSEAQLSTPERKCIGGPE